MQLRKKYEQTCCFCKWVHVEWEWTATKYGPEAWILDHSTRIERQTRVILAASQKFGARVLFLTGKPRFFDWQARVTFPKQRPHLLVGALTEKSQSGKWTFLPSLFNEKMELNIVTWIEWNHGGEIDVAFFNGIRTRK